MTGTGGWSGRRVCVTGVAVSGAAAARALAALGADVTVIDGFAGELQQ